MVKVTLKYRKIHESTLEYFKSLTPVTVQTYLSSLCQVTVENVRDCIRTLQLNKAYISDKDFKHINFCENVVLEKLISMITFEKTQCSICLENTATHQHCTRCLNRDTVVCKGCIVNMLKFSPRERIIYYECPHCRLLITQPKWTLSNPKALRKIISLHKQFIDCIMESDSEDDLTDGELMDDELMDGGLVDGVEYGLFEI